MKTIKDLMTPSPQYCEKNESLKDVARKMAQSNIGSLPVVDENKKVIGMITDRDIALALGRRQGAVAEVQVHEAMTPQVHSLRADEDATAALKMMRTQKVGRLPVVDAENHLKGIISLNGIVRKVQDSSDKAEINYSGKENVHRTLESIAERNRKFETVKDFAD
jgi:CBS domain-containing protein